MARSELKLHYRSTDGRIKISHLGGVPWHEAPLPPKFHACWVQTEGWINYFTPISRCACGAVSQDHLGLGWIEKNSRRRTRVKTKRVSERKWWAPWRK